MAKPYVDGLALVGVIEDDAWRSITRVHPPVEYRKGVQMTILEVEQIV